MNQKLICIFQYQIILISQRLEKIKANPKGFMTQVIQNIQQVQNLADNLKQFSIIPIILFPSEKKSKICRFFGIEFRRI